MTNEQLAVLLMQIGRQINIGLQEVDEALVKAGISPERCCDVIYTLRNVADSMTLNSQRILKGE